MRAIRDVSCCRVSAWPYSWVSDFRNWVSSAAIAGLIRIGFGDPISAGPRVADAIGAERLPRVEPAVGHLGAAQDADVVLPVTGHRQPVPERSRPPRLRGTPG